MIFADGRYRDLRHHETRSDGPPLPLVERNLNALPQPAILVNDKGIAVRGQRNVNDRHRVALPKPAAARARP